MATYSIEVSRSAERLLKKLPAPDQQRLASAMLALAEHPRPRGTRKLAGYDDIYRIRVGPYRILYSVSDTELIVLVLKIGQRRSVY